VPVTGQDDDELIRLASRIAMLASDPGEAANAGRAAGVMARRLGLSGGDLKEIFVAGLRATGPGRRAGPSRDLLRENEALREHLEVAEIAAHQAMRERDRLRADLELMKGAIQSRRRNDVLAMVVGVVLVGAATFGGAWFLASPSPAPTAAAQAAAQGLASGERVAIIRDVGAVVRVHPEPQAEVMAQLAPGSRITVHRLIWGALLQWAEIDFGDRTGYVDVTDVQL